MLPLRSLIRICMILIQFTDYIILVYQIIGIDSSELINGKGDLVVLSRVVYHILVGSSLERNYFILLQ